MSEQSLRDRKKANTRRALVAVSQRLFREQGYEATTLEQICAEVEVHVRTLLRYFETKEQLALAFEYDALERFRAGLLATDREVDTLTFWRAFVGQEVQQALANRHYLAHLELLLSVPSLSARALAVYREYEDLLAASLAEEAGGGSTAVFRARMLAALLNGGNTAVVRDWAASGGSGDLESICLAVVDFASTTLAVGAVAEG